LSTPILVSDKVDFGFGGLGWWGGSDPHVLTSLRLLEEDVHEGLLLWGWRKLDLLSVLGCGAWGLDEDDLVVFIRLWLGFVRSGPGRFPFWINFVSCSSLPK